VVESFVLTTTRPCASKEQLPLKKKVLPYVIEWPKHDYYTNKGVFLPAPEFWEDKEDDVSDNECDFSAKSPIKAFNPRK
jgi:hypothetical protein